MSRPNFVTRFARASAVDLAALREIPTHDVFGSRSSLAAAEVFGRNSAFDGQPASFNFDTESTAADDSAITIQPNDLGNTDKGRWIRAIESGAVNVEWFGAVPGGPQNAQAIINAIAYATANGRSLFLPRIYEINQKITITAENLVIRGCGPLISGLKYIGTDSIDSVIEIQGATYATTPTPSGAYYESTSGYGFGKSVSDIGIQGNANCASVLKLSRIAHGSFERLALGGAATQNLLLDGAVFLHLRDISTSHRIGITDGPAPAHGVFVTGSGGYASSNIDCSGLISEGATDYAIVLENVTQSAFTGCTGETGLHLVTANLNTICGGKFSAIVLEATSGKNTLVGSSYVTFVTNLGAGNSLTGVNQI